MSLEEMLTGTLHAADDYAPSPDLFAKVQRSIEGDDAHRRRVRSVILWVGAAVAAIRVFLLVTVRVESGRIDMSFASLELLVTAVMIAIVSVMGPAIRRFGQTCEQAVFADNPETGRQVLRLLDIAYYLIFVAYIAMTLMFEPPPRPAAARYPIHRHALVRGRKARRSIAADGRAPRRTASRASSGRLDPQRKSTQSSHRRRCTQRRRFGSKGRPGGSPWGPGSLPFTYSSRWP